MKSIILGNFDGVHIAHKKLIQKATQNNGETIAFIFDKHPSILLGKNVPIIMPNSIKRETIENLGCTVHYEPLTQAVLDTEPEDFAREFLHKKFNADVVFAGYNYTFGKKGAGKISDLKEYGKKYGFSVEVMEEVKIDNQTVSSTLIRRLLEEGNIEKANSLLSLPYRIRSKVSEGKKLGRNLGFPTINTEFEENLVIPKSGVYISKTLIDGKEYKSVTNIGTNPTLQNVKRRAESHILDFSGNVYGKTADVILLKYIREEKKFSSAEALSAQVKQDIEKCKNFFNKTFDK